jgi:hypothetical protein
MANSKWRLRVSRATAIFATSLLVLSVTSSGFADERYDAQTLSPAPAIQVHELSSRELGNLGISESSFQQPNNPALNPTWTIPTGEQTQGTGGNPPPCPKDVTPTTQSSPPFIGGSPGPVFTWATNPPPAGTTAPGTTAPGTTTPPTQGTTGCTPYPNPNNPNTPYNPYYPNDPIPTGGGVIGTIGSSVIILDRIVNIGKNIWQFVKDGHAVVNIDMPSASALPQGVNSAAELEGWEPMTKNYQVIVPSSGSKRQIEFVFRITLWHSGSYRGAGSYISNLTVQAADYKVNWGQEFNVRARIPNEGLVNVSKSAENPIAAAQVLVEWSRGKTWSTQGNSAVIYVRGDGQIKNLSAPDDEPEDLYPIGKGGNKGKSRR